MPNSDVSSGDLKTSLKVDEPITEEGRLISGSLPARSNYFNLGIHHCLKILTAQKTSRICARLRLYPLLLHEKELSGKSLISIVFLVLVHDAVCSHFWGGTCTYKPVNPSDPTNTKESLFSKNLNFFESCTRVTLSNNVYLSAFSFSFAAWANISHVTCLFSTSLFNTQP